MRLIAPRNNQRERWQYVRWVVLKEFGLHLHEIRKATYYDNTTLCKCMLALILHEEQAKAVYIAKIINIARTSIYSRLKVADNLLQTHSEFKRKYLKIIQIITANED